MPGKPYPNLLKNIPSEVYSQLAFIDDVMRTEGFEIFLVGGCVRDLLLNKIPNEFDFTSNAKPDQIEKLAAALRKAGLPE